MIEILPGSDGKVLGISVLGKLTGEDYREILMPRLQEMIRDHGRVRVLLLLDADFEGVDTKVIMAENFGQEHKDEFEKIAVVGGSWLIRLELKAITLWFSGVLKNFSRAELTQAWDWVKA